jgi:serine/threonine-protein kinase
MTTLAGTRLGSYEIVTALGAGGMGEVYRARDTRLDRDAAVKILPELFAADPERLVRFEREAKTLASLNHPHIAQIYGIEEMPGGSGTALVMELVEGDDLSVRIARGPMTVAEALPIAQQIADALEAAHDRGIIHRDLKPANIKVSAEGVVKVLDFGLAKAIEGRDTSVDAANSPTMAMTGTVAGLILGTAGYMAPEQARGQVVDRRVDVWAFGVVLFEMLTGKQAFSGDTISDVLASVLKNDLDWALLPKNLPEPVLRLLRRCLNPDRRNRLRDIGEARIAIADLLAGKVEPGSDVAGRRGGAGSPPYLAAALALATLVAAVAMALYLAAGRTPPEASRRFVISPPEGVSAHVVSRPSISLAPDGWTLAFAGLDKGVPHLYIRGAADFDPRQLPDTAGASNPVFAPDGKSLAFFSGNQLIVMPLDGGPQRLAMVNDPRGLTWVDATTVVFSPESVGGLVELAVGGGAPRALTTIDEQAQERTHRWPHALPGGRWVLFTVGTSASPDDYDNARIDAVDRNTGQRREVFQGASMARYASTGHLVFARGGSLFAVPFDADSLKTSGTPVSVVPGVGGDRTTGAAHVSWTDNGTLAYVPGDSRGGMRQLVWSDLKGSRESINLPPALYNDIRISPDGTRMALADNSSGSADIWVYAFARGTHTRLTFTGINGTPAWSADGREVFFSAIDRNGRSSTVFKTSADGGREPTAVVRLDIRGYLKHVSRDASWALVDYIAFGGARANIGRLALREGAKVEPLLETRADEVGAALAPDGRFVAYQSDDSGRPEVYVRELEASAGRWQVSNAGGEEPMWAPDGKALFYRIEDRLMRVPVESTPTFTQGLPALVLDGIYNLRSDTGVSYDVHPNGTRLLMTRPADVASSGTIRVITSWFDVLRAIK